MNDLCQITVWPKPLGYRSHSCNRRAKFSISASADVEFVKLGWVEHVCGIHKNQMVREGWTLVETECQL